MKKYMIFLAGFVLLLAGCPRSEGGGTPPSKVTEYTVTYSHTPDEGGSLIAKIKGGAAFANGRKVPANTVLEFTAIPKDGYRVKEWTGATANTGDITKATLIVKKNVAVEVTFTADQQHTITFSAEPATGGSITAKRKDNGVFITSGRQVDEETEIVFTATPSTAGKGYYILGWSGEDLKISSDKKNAELTVKKDSEVKVVFQQYLIENPNWEAAGILKTKGGTSQKFYLVISDGNTLTVFDSSLGLANSKFGRMSYDPNTKTLSFLPKQGGSGLIKFTSIPQSPLPADWTVQLENVKVGDLDLPDQSVTINVTFNKDNFIH